jgi:uncharacterized protein (DUF433 family)
LSRTQRVGDVYLRLTAVDRTPVRDILALYSDLEAEDIREALQYAAETVRERELPLVTLP